MERRIPLKRETEHAASFIITGVPSEIICGLGEKVERMMELSWTEEDTSNVLSIDILIGRIKEQLEGLNNLDRGETGG